jgi:AcrR family transcriptional regulator
VIENSQDLRRWRLPRGRHGLPRELVKRSQRERLLAAVVRVTVTKGYEATTVGDILGEAGVGRESFYELFADKLDCMLAAHKVLVDDLEEQVRSTYASAGPWPERARGALTTALEWFSNNSGSARFMLVEMSTIGPAFHVIFQEAYARFTRLLDEGLDDEGPSPELTGATGLAFGAIVARVYEEVVLGRTEELLDLLPELTYEFLVPFVGEEAARAAATRG